MTAALAKLGAAALSDNRETIGWLLAAVLSPIILVTVVLCSVGEGGEDHNKAAISACFYGVSYTEQVPEAYREHIDDISVFLPRG
ncbi:MAG: hypothetical protein IKN81_08595 [Oscillospiraceae bacterium]|nr:hypothetical protein [Oscillospiraceae bacterium]